MFLVSHTLTLVGKIPWRRDRPPTPGFLGFPGDSVIKNLPASAGVTGSIPGSGRSPGGGNGNPRQYSCLENPMNRGAWQATVQRVAKGQTQLNDQAQAYWPSCFEDEKTNRKSKELELYFHFFSILFSNLHSFSRFFHSCWVILHFTKLDTAWNHLGQIPITMESPITSCQVVSICFSPLLQPGLLYGGSLGVATW